jgi:quercetin dioxygenase-like cupin family protein
MSVLAGWPDSDTPSSLAVEVWGMTGSDSSAEPLVRHGDDITYETVEAADGLRKGVLVDESHGAPNVAIRRFTLAPGGEVPRHTNEIEHEQYVLSGEYVVGIEDEEYTVSAGDALHIPAGAVHWYRNDGDEEGAFICAVPTGDDEIRLAE